jgi:hypothetical protein
MAFCPEGGKAAATDAEQCASCGQHFEHADKKVGAARFKGTMMMATPVIAQPRGAANANADSVDNVASSDSDPPILAEVVEPAQARKLNAKATMIGTGISPDVMRVIQQGAPSGRVVVDVTGRSSSSGAADAAHAIPFASTQVAFSQPTAADPRLVETAHATVASEAQRYLPGDPMAPQPMAASRGSSPRLSDSLEAAAPEAREERKWLYIAVCAAVVLSVLVLAIGFME